MFKTSNNVNACSNYDFDQDNFNNEQIEGDQHINSEEVKQHSISDARINNQLDDTNRKSSTLKDHSKYSEQDQLKDSAHVYNVEAQSSKHDQRDADDDNDEYDEYEFGNLQSDRQDVKKQNAEPVDSPRVEDEPVQANKSNISNKPNKLDKSPEIQEENPYQNNDQDDYQDEQDEQNDNSRHSRKHESKVDDYEDHNYGNDSNHGRAQEHSKEEYEIDTLPQKPNMELNGKLRWQFC